MKLLYTTLVIATHNKGKFAEFSRILAPFSLELKPLSAYTAHAPVESGSSFIENARLKAEQAMHLTNLPCLADDSGLCVDAMDGRPGIHSARWAQALGSFDQAMEDILQHVRSKPFLGHGARMVCALAFARPSAPTQVLERSVIGTIVDSQGRKGFGYDPIFKPTGATQTFAEMDPDKKDHVDWTNRVAMSHRARALMEGVLQWMVEKE